MENEYRFIQVLYVSLLYASPVIFLFGLVFIAVVEPEKRKFGLRIIIAAVIMFIIGFGICLNNLGM